MNEEIQARREMSRVNARAEVEAWLALTPEPTRDLIASFQWAVIEELLNRAAACAREIGAKCLIVSGGVACNAGLRAAADRRGLGIPVYFPQPVLSTDNAAMIAAAALPAFWAGRFADLSLRATAHLLPAGLVQ